MAGKRKVGRPPGGTKGSVLSVRVSPEMRTELEAEARKNKRGLSSEVQTRLGYTLARHMVGRPPHIMALSGAVAVAARVVEEATGRPWNKDQYTSRHLATAIGLVIAAFSQPGKVTIPPKVIEKAKRHTAGDAYPIHLGEVEAKGIIALLKLAPAPWGPSYPEVYFEAYKIRRALEPRRRK
jgi:hypothetical protein